MPIKTDDNTDFSKGCVIYLEAIVGRHVIIFFIEVLRLIDMYHLGNSYDLSLVVYHQRYIIFL